MNVSISIRGEVFFVALVGDLDETFVAPSVAAECKSVLVDASAVRRVSSAGVKRWIEFRAGIAPELVFECEKMSPAMFRQFLMIRNFLSAAEVVSINAPLYCEQCDQSAEATLRLPNVRGYCEKCSCGGERFLDVPVEFEAVIAEMT